MQAFARAPNEMSDKGAMDKNWKVFKEQFLTFMKITEGNLETSDKQAIMLLNLMGEVGQEALQNIPFEYPEEKENIQILLEKFDDYFDPPKKEANERYKFFTRTRKPNESIEDFIADLREKAKTCNFEPLADSLIRDKVILDTKDKLLRKLLLDTDDLDLTKIVTIYKSHEMATEKIKQIYKEKTKQAQATNVTPSTTNTEMENNSTNCSRCGTHHPYGSCPAWGKKCGKCQGLGHYTHRCTPNLAQRSRRPHKEPNKNVASPFSQIDKNTKTGNAHNKFRTSENQQNVYPSDGQIPPLMPPPAYTPYPAPTEACDGYMQSRASQPAYNAQSNGATNCRNAFVTSQSTTKKIPLPTCSVQYAFSSYSGAGSAPPLDSHNVTVTSNAQTTGSLYPNFPQNTSSNAKSTTMTNLRSNDAALSYGEDVVNSATINQKKPPGRAMQFVIDPASIIQDFVTIGLESNSSRKQSNPPATQPARQTTEKPKTSTSTPFSNSSSGSQSRNRQSNESSDKCVIS